MASSFFCGWQAVGVAPASPPGHARSSASTIFWATMMTMVTVRHLPSPNMIFLPGLHGGGIAAISKKGPERPVLGR